MKRIIIIMAALLAVLQLTAADIDMQTAQAKAQRFLAGKATKNGFAAKPAVKWVHQEMNSSNASQAAYYIVNTDQGFVIVAGDDRAQEILGYGSGTIDMNTMPENMKVWLGYYKAQLEYLQAHPGMIVEKPARRGGVTVAPMVEAMWDQGSPYYSQCPITGDVRAQTGCAATSLAQVFYKWKFPTNPTPVIPGYTTATLGLELGALPSVTFDWENMLPTYNFGHYNDVNKNAVAQLMRYIGQAEHMDYNSTFGEAYEEDILRACHTFGYVGAHIAYKSILYANGVDSVYIGDDEWSEMLQNELIAGRPVVYCAISYSSVYNSYYGHAFNVDGYNAEDGTYSINWGWSGVGNGYFALNAFANQGNSYTLGQLMVMGIEPPAPVESYDPVMLRADERYIDLTSFRAEWTDETPDENVVSYTLEVAAEGGDPGVYEKVFSESFPYCNSSSNTAISNFNNYCANAGWTGTRAYEAKGGLRLGNADRSGSITTPALDMTQSGGKMTVVASMKPYNTDTNVPVTISCGTSIANVTVTAEGTQTVILECEADENQKVTFSTVEGGKRVIITQVDIYSSTPSSGKKVFSLRAEEGDANSRVITDITDKFYTVNGLAEGGTFTYRVKAYYINGTQSAWSNVETVTLHESQHQHQPGDVDKDGSVGISDVSILIDYLLGTEIGDFCGTCGDVDADGSVAIADVSVLIDILLGN